MHLGYCLFFIGLSIYCQRRKRKVLSLWFQINRLNIKVHRESFYFRLLAFAERSTRQTNSFASPKYHLLLRFSLKPVFRWIRASSLRPRKPRYRECRCQVAGASVSLAASPRLSWTFCWTWRLRGMTRSKLQRRIAARTTVGSRRNSPSHEERTFFESQSLAEFSLELFE